VNVPCYAYRLRHLERCLERLPVGWSYSIYPKPNAYENQGWSEITCFCCSDLVDFVLVYIWAVCVDVYTEPGLFVLVSESSANRVSEFSLHHVEARRAYCIHLAVAEGPNHSPGCFPQAEAPCSTKRCTEKGAFGSSANNDRR
jgi:hypothetical protein